MAERILLVEDEEKLARMVELELKYEGYEELSTVGGEGAGRPERAGAGPERGL